MNLTVGKLLQDGKYRIDAVLGVGEFGVTYRASHAYLGQIVALKTLNERLRQHPDFARLQRQFIVEAQKLAHCQHPNLVRFLDFFEEAGQSFVAMDYIPGQTLTQLIEFNGPLPESLALHYIRQIGSALVTLHQCGLLHRDLKPENIIRRTDTHLVMLADWGIGHGTWGIGPKSNHPTPPLEGYDVHHAVESGFLSPSSQAQFSGANSPYTALEYYPPTDISEETGFSPHPGPQLTPASDLYALAGILYYLLTGISPVAAPLRSQTPLPSARDFQPNLSPETEKAILCGLQLDPHHRPQTLESWLTMLPSPEILTSRQVNTQKSPQLPVLPSPKVLLLIFTVTAGLAGWMGFDLARRYAGLKITKRLPSTDFPAWENLLNPEFRLQDPSVPLFSKPSVESSPSLPTPSEEPFPEVPESINTAPSPNVSPSPEPAAEATPEPSTPTLEPEPEFSETEPPAEFYAPDSPEQPELYTPEPSPPPVTETTRSVPIPKVAPLPPEPQASEPMPSPTPVAPAPSDNFSSVEPPPEPSAEPEPILPQPEPPAPSLTEEDSLLDLDNPATEPPLATPDATVPFPEPTAN